MRILLAGASGLIGRALASACVAAGDDIRVLVRRAPTTAHELQWQPGVAELDPAALEGVDAVVCLSGAGVGEHRWTETFRRTILESRTNSVATLARAIAATADRPPVFITASAIGYYGDTGDQVVDESAPNGTGYFPEVCRAWEAAASPAIEAGVRVAHIRTGIVIARGGEVLGRMLPLFRFGLGGRLGNGREYWSWITLADEIAAVRFLLTADGVDGPVNLTAPKPVTNTEFTRTLAGLLHRPAVLAVPSIALRIGLGDLAGEITASARVIPAKLTAAGFEFAHPTIEDGLRAELAG